jgi:Flp pilus assembly protein TadD
MSRLSLGSSISALALASLLASCAAPGGVRTAANRASDQPKLGFATQALVALNANDFANAAAYAEQAVEKSPQDATVRALLANAYFGAGRFASAEAAFKDSLTLNDNQPKVVLKLALVEIAQGKQAEANGLLEAARQILDPADYGLAVALAGRPQDGIATLEPAARMRGADARVRQNLALSYALAGDWNKARTIAAQDVPGDQLDQRIQDWMRLTSSPRPSDQVAALTGVSPVAGDPGQPVRLALRDSSGAVLSAQLQPAPVVPASPAAAQVQVAQAAPVGVYAPPPIAPVQQQAAPETEEPFVEVPPARPQLAATPKARPATPAKTVLRPAAYVPKKVAARPAALRASGKSTAVVQLGAYGSRDRVAAAWNNAARRYSALRAYMPVSARFQSAKGLFYRLSVKGFQSPDQAKNLCIALRRAGGSCFVRDVAGDAPVQLALR